MITPLIKKPAGSFTKERRAKARKRKRSEHDIMADAMERDGHQCRVPAWDRSCLMSGQPIDPCHMTHRGMGGNPKGDRTTRQTIIALCRTHHRLYDSGELDIKPLTHDLFDGPCEFHIEIQRGVPKTFLGITAPSLTVGGVE